MFLYHTLFRIFEFPKHKKSRVCILKVMLKKARNFQDIVLFRDLFCVVLIMSQIFFFPIFDTISVNLDFAFIPLAALIIQPQKKNPYSPPNQFARIQNP